MLYSKPTAQQISIVGSNSIDIYANKAGSESYIAKDTAGETVTEAT
jgi:hypothetical protein